MWYKLLSPRDTVPRVVNCLLHIPSSIRPIPPCAVRTSFPQAIASGTLKTCHAKKRDNLGTLAAARYHWFPPHFYPSQRITSHNSPRNCPQSVPKRSSRFSTLPYTVAAFLAGPVMMVVRSIYHNCSELLAATATGVAAKIWPFVWAPVAVSSYRPASNLPVRCRKRSIERIWIFGLNGKKR